MKKCPKCNGKLVLLQKRVVFRLGRDSLKKIETYQPLRCKRCGEEFKNV